MKRIAIHSVPRSGSSWLGQIFNSSPDVLFRFQPLFSYAFKDYLTPSSTAKDINTFFNEIAQSNDPFLLQKDKVDQGIYPAFTKSTYPTHIVYKEVRYHHILENLLTVDNQVIVIGLIRNPYAVIHSFLNAPREFRKDLGWDELEEWRHASKKNLDRPEEFFGYEKWKETALLFQKLKETFPDRFYLVKYDNLLIDPLKEITKIFSFCGIPLQEQTKKFLIESKMKDHKDVYSVYKNRNLDNQWNETLASTIIAEITQDLKHNALEEYLVE